MELTRQAASDINVFEGIRTPRQKSRYPPKVHLDAPCALNGRYIVSDRGEVLEKAGAPDALEHT